MTPFAKSLISFLFLFIIYVALGKLGLETTSLSKFATLLWAPSGIALAALLLGGGVYAPVIFLAAWTLNMWVGARWDVAACIAVGNLAEALLAWWLLRKMSFQKSFEFASETWKFMLTALVAPGIAALVGPVVLHSQGYIEEGSLGSVITSWWIGDMAGIVIITPLVLSWKRSSVREALWTVKTFPNWKNVEVISLYISAIVMSWLVYGSPISYLGDPLTPRFYFLVPIFLWAAMRFTQKELTLVIGVTVLGAILGLNYPSLESQLTNAHKALFEIEIFYIFATPVFLTVLAIGLQQDSLKRKMLKNEEELKEKTRELESRNLELERFASFASHDLKEPLRTIQTWINVLEEDLEGKLSQTHKEYFHFVIDASKRLSRLIESLLGYAQADRGPQRLENVNVRIEVEQVLNLLKDEIETQNASIILGFLPTVIWDPVAVSQIFQNLISNALKYRSEKSPLIEIFGDRKNKESVFAVRDNGVGFNMADTDKIFEAFYRLKRTDQSDGSGIGLTVVKTMVEKRGGKIWAESTVGEGSTFFISIPDLKN